MASRGRWLLRSTEDLHAVGLHLGRNILALGESDGCWSPISVSTIILFGVKNLQDFGVDKLGTGKLWQDEPEEEDGLDEEVEWDKVEDRV